MTKTKCFISFDYDNDSVLKELLVGQSRNDDSPFEIADWSIKEASADWKEQARARIKRSEVVIVICGEHTASANGVAIETSIAQEEKVPYFLLCGYHGKKCEKPKTAKKEDAIYKWTWDNLKKLVGGAR